MILHINPFCHGNTNTVAAAYIEFRLSEISTKEEPFFKKIIFPTVITTGYMELWRMQPKKSGAQQLFHDCSLPATIREA